MNAKLRKFLVIATALCVSVAPALSQNRAGAGRMSVVADARVPAQIGEIAARDIDAYQKRMRSAQAITDPPRRDAAITSARQELARDTHKPLTAGTIAELDGLLDIGGASPQLGASG